MSRQGSFASTRARVTVGARGLGARGSLVDSVQIKQLADVCAAWLAGDWQKLELPAGATSEEVALFDTLTGIRTRLMLTTASEPSCGDAGGLQECLREAEVLLEAAKVLTSTLELEPLLKATIDSIGKVFELSDGGAVFLYNQASETLDLVASFGYPTSPDFSQLLPGEGAPGMAFVLRQPLLAIGPEEVARYDATIRDERICSVKKFQHSHSLPSQSVLCVPFIVKGRAVGSLALEHWTDQRTFSESDLRLLAHLGDLIAIAVDNGMLWSELRTKEDRLHQMVGRMISAQEEERKRIARELHDDAGQALTLVMVSLSGLEGVLPPDMLEARARIADLRTSVKELMCRIRDLTFALRPSVLDDLGLAAALRWYARCFAGPQAPKVTLDLEDIGKSIDPAVATVLFRVGQEALNNAFRHSGATEIKVGLHQVHDAFVLTIEDNGAGFRVDEVMREPQESLGLHGMSERLTMVNGVLKVRSVPTRGTTVRACVPLKDSISQTEVRR